MSYHQMSYHVVFATKYRQRWLKPDRRERLYKYVGGIIRSFDGSLLEIGGIDDHVHMLVNIPPVVAVADALRTIKANSSKWATQQKVLADEFSWQKGYAAFTVSYSQQDKVARYIRDQEFHHRKLDFRDEYIALLKKHGIAFELRYLFDDEHHG